jgi:hypothetical protein
MYFTSMIAVVMEFAVLLKVEIYWPRPEGLAHRTSHDEQCQLDAGKVFDVQGL